MVVVLHRQNYRNVKKKELLNTDSCFGTKWSSYYSFDRHERDGTNYRCVQGKGDMYSKERRRLSGEKKKSCCNFSGRSCQFVGVIFLPFEFQAK